MVDRPATCKPALGYDWLLPLYDPLHRWLLRESTLKHLLIQQADIGPGQRMLDLACGTGTLALMLQRDQPRSRIYGLDADPKALRRAQDKATRAASPIRLQLGLSYELPYPDHCFDHIFSSFAFHHLSHLHKRQTLAQVQRVLAPGGAFHLLDLGAPATALGAHLTRLLHPDGATRDNVHGLLPQFMAAAGLVHVRQTHRCLTPIGWAAYYGGRTAATPDCAAEPLVEPVSSRAFS